MNRGVAEGRKKKEDIRKIWDSYVARLYGEKSGRRREKKDRQLEDVGL
jgi:predicted site-specific integrase-resolvase